MNLLVHHFLRLSSMWACVRWSWRKQKATEENIPTRETQKMSSVIARPLNLWTARHFAVMWPFLAGGFYVGLKFFELFRPSAISDEDKKNSRMCRNIFHQYLDTR